MFLSHSETLHCENKIDKEFDNSPTKSKSSFELSKESVIVTLLIISAVFTYFQLSLKYVLKHLSTLIEHIQKLEILYEFGVRFHAKARKSNLSCFTDCTKHASAGALIHRQQTIHWIFTQTKLSSNYRHKPIVTYWAFTKCQALLSIYLFFLLFGRDDSPEILASVWQEEKNFEVLKRCYIQMYSTSF